ncbi:MAG: hypothetical protein Hyperionvirus32_15 [Hyperionvirus sp.]|uniref:Uncharacterized protein n=1 Tax=Hyperionvirus sp. TaxID=2487770 RepID=A0A3G5ABM5_9VIRU|nr:MAG: hypothetical protein Hyperionvirus32_15 [Hyperionvirus sp.]
MEPSEDEIKRGASAVSESTTARPVERESRARVVVFSKAMGTVDRILVFIMPGLNADKNPRMNPLMNELRVAIAQLKSLREMNEKICYKVIAQYETAMMEMIHTKEKLGEWTRNRNRLEREKETEVGLSGRYTKSIIIATKIEKNLMQHEIMQMVAGLGKSTLMHRYYAHHFSLGLCIYDYLLFSEPVFAFEISKNSIFEDGSGVVVFGITAKDIGLCYPEILWEIS